MCWVGTCECFFLFRLVKVTMCWVGESDSMWCWKLCFIFILVKMSVSVGLETVFRVDKRLYVALVNVS